MTLGFYILDNIIEQGESAMNFGLMRTFQNSNFKTKKNINAEVYSIVAKTKLENKEHSTLIGAPF